jgi:hypothetical protein
MEEYWINTYSGKKFDYVKLYPEQFDITDIARALSFIPRYCGQTDKFCSVAEHSVNVCHLVKNSRAKFWGLMHDAAEAYFGDVPRPFKWLVPQIGEIELRIQKAIISRFDIPYDKEISEEVKRWDKVMLVTENKQLRVNGVNWGCYKDIKPANFDLVCMTPPIAEKLFLNMFHDVCKDVLQESKLK